MHVAEPARINRNSQTYNITSTSSIHHHHPTNHCSPLMQEVSLPPWSLAYQAPVAALAWPSQAKLAHQTHIGLAGHHCLHLVLTDWKAPDRTWSEIPRLPGGSICSVVLSSLVVFRNSRGSKFQSKNPGSSTMRQRHLIITWMRALTFS